MAHYQMKIEATDEQYKSALYVGPLGDQGPWTFIGWVRRDSGFPGDRLPSRWTALLPNGDPLPRTFVTESSANDALLEASKLGYR